MFWRIDKFRKGTGNEECYIALRHYDGHARSQNSQNNARKKAVYQELRSAAMALNDPYGFIQNIGQRANYKESDLVFIPVSGLKHIGGFAEVKSYLLKVTKDMKSFAVQMQRY
jgi:hypothetical protein